MISQYHFDHFHRGRVSHTHPAHEMRSDAELLERVVVEFLDAGEGHIGDVGTFLNDDHRDIARAFHR